MLGNLRSRPHHPDVSCADNLDLDDLDHGDAVVDDLDDLAAASSTTVISVFTTAATVFPTILRARRRRGLAQRS
jgi:hypothetical protein